MKKALYIHGLASGSNSKTGKLLKQYIDGYEWTCAEVNHHCEESLRIIYDLLWVNDYDLVCGTSLGGFYILCMADYIKGQMVVVNPVLNAREDLRQFIGENRYFCKRLNGDKTFVLTEDDCQKMCCREFIQHQIETHNKRITLIYSDHDQVLGLDYHYNYRTLFNNLIKTSLMGHSMTEEFIAKELLGIVEALRDRPSSSPAIFKGINAPNLKFNVVDFVLAQDGRLPGIVAAAPVSPQWVYYYEYPRVGQPGTRGDGWLMNIHLDDSDDVYYVFTKGDGDTHQHIPSADMRPYPYNLGMLDKLCLVAKLKEMDEGYRLYDKSKLSRLSTQFTGLSLAIDLYQRSRQSDTEPLIFVEITCPGYEGYDLVPVFIGDEKPIFKCSRLIIHPSGRDAIVQWILQNRAHLIYHWNGKMTTDEALDLLTPIQH